MTSESQKPRVPNVNTQISNQVKLTQLKFTYLCHSLSSLLDYLSQTALYEQQLQAEENLENSEIPHVSKTLLTGMFVRNFASHCQKFFKNFIHQAGDKLPGSQIKELNRIFTEIFNSAEQIGKGDKNGRNVPSETKKLASELFTNEIEPSKDKSEFKMTSLLDQLNQTTSVWTAEEVKDIQRRNMIGEVVQDREAYDVLEDPYQSPVISPKKKTLIESLEIEHTKRKKLEFIRDVNKLLFNREVLQIPGWKNGGKTSFLTLTFRLLHRYEVGK